VCILDVQDGQLWDSEAVLRATGAPVLCLELVGPNLLVSGVGFDGRVFFPGHGRLLVKCLHACLTYTEMLLHMLSMMQCTC
jgi:hypothetical protein